MPNRTWRELIPHTASVGGSSESLRLDAVIVALNRMSGCDLLVLRSALNPSISLMFYNRESSGTAVAIAWCVESSRFNCKF